METLKKEDKVGIENLAMAEFFLGTEWLQPGAKGSTFTAFMDLPESYDRKFIHETYLANYDYQLSEAYGDYSIGQIKTMLTEKVSEIESILSQEEIVSVIKEEPTFSVKELIETLQALRGRGEKEISLEDLGKQVTQDNAPAMTFPEYPGNH